MQNKLVYETVFLIFNFDNNVKLASIHKLKEESKCNVRSTIKKKILAKVELFSILKPRVVYPRPFSSSPPFSKF